MRSLLLFAFCALFYSVSCLAQKEGMELTTGRIGPFRIGMTKSEAQMLTRQNININREEGKYEIDVLVTYNGEIIKLTFYPDYQNGEKTGIDVIEDIRTSSLKFRTKNAMGVGSTRYELLNVYKDYPNFEISPSWKECRKPDASTSYFVLKDEDVVLCFKLVNNIAVEVSIGLRRGTE